MKKSILNIGRALSKAEQQTINGGGRPCSDDCFWPGAAGDYCRTSACEFGQCSNSLICEAL